MAEFAHSAGSILSTPDHVRIGYTVDILNAIHEAGVNLAIWRRANPQQAIADAALASPDLYKKDGALFKKSKIEFCIHRDLRELPLVESHLKNQCDIDLSYLYPKRKEMIESFFRLFPDTDMVRYESRVIGPSAATVLSHTFHVDRQPECVLSKSKSFMISTDIGEQATEWLQSGEFTLELLVDPFGEQEEYIAKPKNQNSVRHMKPDDVALMWPGSSVDNGLYHRTPDKNPRALAVLYEPLMRQRRDPYPAPSYDWAPT